MTLLITQNNTARLRQNRHSARRGMRLKLLIGTAIVVLNFTGEAVAMEEQENSQNSRSLRPPSGLRPRSGSQDYPAWKPDEIINGLEKEERVAEEEKLVAQTVRINGLRKAWEEYRQNHPGELSGSSGSSW